MNGSPLPNSIRYCAAAACALLWGAAIVVGWTETVVAQDALDGLAAARNLEQAFVKVIADAEPAVVSIARTKRLKPSSIATQLDPFQLDLATRNLTRDASRPSDPQFVPNEFGAGIVIAPRQNEPVILTNYHVVKGGPALKDDDQSSEFSLYVRFADRRGYEAKILAADPRSDLAVLQIDFRALGVEPGHVKALKIADAPDLRKGQLVLALGNPYAIGRDGSASASWGMISNIARRPATTSSANVELQRRTDETIHHYGTLLQVDTRLNLGTSGGALLDLNGELIGMTTSLAALDGYETSVGYAIPTDAAIRRVIESLVDGYEAEYGFLGVVPQTAQPQDLDRLAEHFGQSTAALVGSVMDGSPAADAKLERDDIIFAVNDATIHDQYDLMREIGGLGPGAVARLRIWGTRVNREKMLLVTLGKWPAVNEQEIIATNYRHPAWRGLRVDYSTARDRFTDQISYPRAVVITEIEPGSPAASAQLRVGDFISHANQTPVRTPAEFHTAVEALSGNVTLQLIEGHNDSRQVVIGK
jgi:serine protease Do